jgi:hypothetical protein
MADTVTPVEYFHITVPNKPGEGERALRALREADVHLLAFSGFPRARAAQIDFVPSDTMAFKQVARRNRWKLSGPKRAFLVRGEDRVGAVEEIFAKLAAAGINVTALDAACAGEGRYGAILWVEPRLFRKAAKVLGAEGTPAPGL